jgi:hypothetical protein
MIYLLLKKLKNITVTNAKFKESLNTFDQYQYISDAC